MLVVFPLLVRNYVAAVVRGSSSSSLFLYVSPTQKEKLTTKKIPSSSSSKMYNVDVEYVKVQEQEDRSPWSRDFKHLYIYSYDIKLGIRNRRSKYKLSLTSLSNDVLFHTQGQSIFLLRMICIEKASYNSSNMILRDQAFNLLSQYSRLFRRSKHELYLFAYFLAIGKHCVTTDLIEDETKPLNQITQYLLYFSSRGCVIVRDNIEHPSIYPICCTVVELLSVKTAIPKHNIQRTSFLYFVEKQTVNMLDKEGVKDSIRSHSSAFFKIKRQISYITEMALLLQQLHIRGCVPLQIRRNIPRPLSGLLIFHSTWSTFSRSACLILHRYARILCVHSEIFVVFPTVSILHRCARNHMCPLRIRIIILTSSRHVTTSKHVPHVSTGPNTITVSENLNVQPSSSKKATSGPKRGDDQCGMTKSASTTPKGLSASFSSRGTATVTKGPASRPSIKQQRSRETQVSEAIIDRSHPDGKITTDRWLLLQEKILRALDDELARSEDDYCVRWPQMVKGCQNHWMRLLQIEIVPLDQVPFRTTVRMWFPPPILEHKSILTLIKRQNKELVTDDWTIERGRTRDNGEGKDLWIKIGSESLRLLRSSQGVIKYGLNQLRLISPAEKRSDESKRPEGAATDDLLRFMEKEVIHVPLIQKPWLAASKVHLYLNFGVSFYKTVMLNPLIVLNSVESESHLVFEISLNRHHHDVIVVRGKILSKASQIYGFLYLTHMGGSNLLTNDFFYLIHMGRSDHPLCKFAHFPQNVEINVTFLRAKFEDNSVSVNGKIRLRRSSREVTVNLLSFSGQGILGVASFDLSPYKKPSFKSIFRYKFGYIVLKKTKTPQRSDCRNNVSNVLLCECFKYVYGGLCSYLPQGVTLSKNLSLAYLIDLYFGLPIASLAAIARLSKTFHIKEMLLKDLGMSTIYKKIPSACSLGIARDIQITTFLFKIHLGLYRACCALLNQCHGWESNPPPPVYQTRTLTTNLPEATLFYFLFNIPNTLSHNFVM
ncbi:hypothetical protein CVS40_1760 [Lucilia cuprina]|nr:hypothetical protein CVS40_1760 [Lucilia cuprina]